ncbi:unnamed protein product [Cercospora beticola]|nr:unnamed protein product [Cercospora beticola]
MRLMGKDLYSKQIESQCHTHTTLYCLSHLLSSSSSPHRIKLAKSIRKEEKVSSPLSAIPYQYFRPSSAKEPQLTLPSHHIIPRYVLSAATPPQRTYSKYFSFTEKKKLAGSGVATADEAGNATSTRIASKLN